MRSAEQSPAGAEKAALRERFTAARAARSEAERDAARTAVRAAVLRHAVGSDRRCVAAYVPLRSEPGSPELLAGLAEAGLRVLVPILLPDRDLDWAPWSAGALGPALGREALGTADLVLVPALAVADDGVRLGRGGGSYDRALPRRRAGVPAVALLFEGERVAALPRDSWDATVSHVVTPAGWETLAGNAGVANRR